MKPEDAQKAVDEVYLALDRSIKAGWITDAQAAEVFRAAAQALLLKEDWDDGPDCLCFEPGCAECGRAQTDLDWTD